VLVDHDRVVAVEPVTARGHEVRPGVRSTGAGVPSDPRPAP
jgi:hypothetical protein